VAAPVTRADLLKFPASRIVFPNSRLLRTVGADQTPTKPGEEPNPAYVGAILVAPTTPSHLYSWYDAALSDRGFRPATDFRLATQVSGQAWQSHRRKQVQIGVYDPALVRSETGIDVVVPPGSVAYEEVFVGYPPGLPKD
jgi:hypothetical protein